MMNDKVTFFLEKIKKYKKRIFLLLILIVQYFSSYLLEYDLARIYYGQRPFFSTTFGVVIFNGGSAQYWGPGYTINLCFSGYTVPPEISRIYHLTYWYWVPFFNFPWNTDRFFTEKELESNRRMWNDRQSGNLTPHDQP